MSSGTFTLTTPTVRLAGGFRVNRQGLVVPSAKLPRRLLAMLLLHPGEILSYQLLSKELWGRYAPSGRPTSLQNYIMGLRRQNGFRGIVNAARRGYTLTDVSADEVDLLQFLSAVKYFHRNPPSTPQKGVEVWEAVLLLLAGEVLVDIDVGTLLERFVLRVEAAKDSAERQLYLCFLQCGRHAELVDILWAQWVKLPAREDIAYMLMLALFRSMRRSDALNVHVDTRKAMRELSRVPSPELERLSTQIERSDGRLLDVSWPIPGL